VTGPLATRREFLTRGAGAVAAAGGLSACAYWLYDESGKAGLDEGGGPELFLGELGETPSPCPLPLGERGVMGHSLRNFFASIDLPASNPRICIATGDDERVEQIVQAAIVGLAPLLGMKQFISSGDVVLIKPNVGFDRPPRLGATTHPEVLRAVIRLSKEAGARQVLVADNPIEAPEVCFVRSGLGGVARAEGAEIVFPTPADFMTLVARAHRPDPSQGEALRRWPVFGTLLTRATKVIGVAPVKDHNLCGGSMALKNWYGLLGGRRDQFHQAIHHIISDLAMVFSPTLVIADATRVMMSNGPTGGRASDVKPGGMLGRAAVVASVDPVACDAWCYENLLGRDPSALAYLELANRKIAARIAGGEKRFAECDWRVYARQGMVVEVAV